MASSYKDHKPCNEQIKKEDRIDGDYIFILFYDYIHKRNWTFIRNKVPIVDQTNATPAIANFNMKIVTPISFKKYTKIAAKTIGKIQYPRTHTHWKKEIFPPSNLVLIVTTKAPPHITKNTTPNSLPLEFIPMFRTLIKLSDTEKVTSREWVVPKDPLNKQKWYNFVTLLHLLGHSPCWT